MIDYNSFLFILAGLALIGGIVFGLFYNRIFTLAFKVKKQNKNNVQNFHLKRGKEEIEEEEDEERNQITKPNVIKKNFQLLEDEIKIYKFEKDLVSRAIENILDASKNKTIDPFEKDRLLLKYNDQLKKLNKKMEELQSEIDIIKLLDLRHDLVSLIENKISDIDEKINEINFNIKDKSNIAGINNQNKKNTAAAIKNKLKDPSSFYDIEETLDANLNSRKVINYKNSNINKKKETVIEAERKKIVNLKEQVLTALNRLDRAGIIKEEIENEIVVMEESKNKKNFMENEIKKPLQSVQNVYNFNNNNEYANLNENRTSSAGITNKDKISVQKIFNFISQSKNKNNTITSSQITSNPLLKSNNTNTQFTIKNDESTNKLKSENPLIKNQDQRNYNGNKSSNSNSNSNSSSPLFNLLNNSNLKFEYSFNVNDYNKNKDKNKDKQSLGNENTKKFKFSLGSIFSKRNKKEKEIEKKAYYDTNTKKRKDSLSNILDK
jgi:hypothetical protein